MKTSRNFFFIVTITSLASYYLTSILSNQRLLIDEERDSEGKLITYEPPELSAQPIPAHLIAHNFAINTVNREQQRQLMEDLNGGLERLDATLSQIEGHIETKAKGIQKLIKGKFERFEAAIKKATSDLNSANP